MTLYSKFLMFLKYNLTLSTSASTDKEASDVTVLGEHDLIGTAEE